MDQATTDTDSYRLRHFVERLIQSDELEIIDDATSLAALASHWVGNPKAVLFRDAGPEHSEIIANLMAGRGRLARAFDTTERDLLQTMLTRIATPQPVVEIDSADAPVHQVVWTGDDADFLRLPIPFQHALDGGPYLSSTIDITVNPETGLTNVGCRRMMITGRQEAGVDATAPSDLRAIYEGCTRRGERLPISFVLGAHPTVHIAGTMRIPGDETGVIARLRGAPLPVVKCVTNGIRVPADAEMILEGYFDERGYVQDEGPFGEFMGYYGLMKQNPVFHLTAITMRNDALFQTSTISGPALRNTDSGCMGALRTESVVWQALKTAIREPVTIYATSSHNVRLSMRPRVPGEARNAIACMFGCLANVKNVFVVDEDVDIFDDLQMDWALATRFQPERDLVVEGGFRTVPIDPSLYGSRIGSKAGFDLTIAQERKGLMEFTVSKAPDFLGEGQGERFDSVEAALADGPKFFQALMAAIGTDDPRAVVPELEQLRKMGRLGRGTDGEFLLKG